jgi:hypothetical protein
MNDTLVTILKFPAWNGWPLMERCGSRGSDLGRLMRMNW